MKEETIKWYTLDEKEPESYSTALIKNKCNEVKTASRSESGVWNCDDWSTEMDCEILAWAELPKGMLKASIERTEEE